MNITLPLTLYERAWYMPLLRLKLNTKDGEAFQRWVMSRRGQEPEIHKTKVAARYQSRVTNHRNWVIVGSGKRRRPFWKSAGQFTGNWATIAGARNCSLI
jgi:hypothetical protein